MTENEKLIQRMKSIQDTFHDQVYYKPTFDSGGKLILVIGNDGKELFRSDRNAVALLNTFIEWCDENYEANGIVPF